MSFWHYRLCRRATAGLFALALILCLLPGLAPAADADELPLRVGFVGADGVLEETRRGVYTGFIVDYLEALSVYTGREYEYVQGSLSYNLKMLREGNLDLLCMVRKTPEREESFLFSELPMVYDHTALRAREDGKYFYGDDALFAGATLGVVGNAWHESVFLDYMASHGGFSGQIARYGSETELIDALHDGSIDLIATGGLGVYDGTRVVARFQAEPTYLITSRNQPELMAELDEAMRRVRADDAGLESRLLEKYFRISANTLSLTRAEQEYINSAGTITVLGFSGRRPLSYLAPDGSLTGVYADYLSLLGSETGLRFAYRRATDTDPEALLAALREQNAVLLCSGPDPATLSSAKGVLSSDVLLETGLAYISTAEGYVPGGDGLRFALPAGLEQLESLLYASGRCGDIHSFENSAECLDAVRLGSADIAILDEQVAAYLLQKPQYADSLHSVEGAAFYGDPLRLYALEENAGLIRIVDKTLASLGKEQRAALINRAMLAHPYRYGFDDIFHAYGRWIVPLLLLSFALLVTGVLAWTRHAGLRSERERAARLHEALLLDELTGICSRKGFFEKAAALIARTEEDLCIVRVNICNFKIVNDLYGTEKGDRLLCEIGDSLRRDAEALGFVAGRFTADHFYICTPLSVYESFPLTRQKKFPWLDIDIYHTYGVYRVGEQRDVPVSSMCDRADMALADRDPTSSAHVCHYNEESRKRLLREQEIESEMDIAIAQRQFCIYIQPKYDVQRDCIVGGEALVRWIHPKKGLISPGEFIPVFESNGFIRELDYYVWEACCAFLRDARDRGLPVPPISVNVSRIHFYGSELQRHLEKLLEKYALRPEDLELEITESIYAEDPDIILRKCDALRGAGFRVEMDDFGSGYSSLNMLKELPLDVVKMDLRFLAEDSDGERQKRGRGILRALVRMVHELQLQVVVEGVETEEQLRFIRELGGCQVQGFYYARPMPCADFEALISE